MGFPASLLSVFPCASPQLALLEQVAMRAGSYKSYTASPVPAMPLPAWRADAAWPRGFGLPFRKVALAQRHRCRTWPRRHMSEPFRRVVAMLTQTKHFGTLPSGVQGRQAPGGGPGSGDRAAARPLPSGAWGSAPHLRAGKSSPKMQIKN